MPEYNHKATLNFTNQNLQNRSFQGQNLTGANFSGADIRGCDFSHTKLVGANFQGVKAGLSHKKVAILLTLGLAGALGLMVAIVGICFLASLMVIATPQAKVLMPPCGTVTIVGIGVLIKAIVSAQGRGANGGLIVAAGFFVVFGALALVAAFFWAIHNFGQSKIIPGMISLLQSFLALAIGLGGFIQLLKLIRNTIGTSFKKADLTKAIFNRAWLQNTDFSGAIIAEVDWRRANLTRCKFPKPKIVKDSSELEQTSGNSSAVNNQVLS
ncbi:MAG TPA: hypothetical protein DDZ80_06835 [Cyanobacteria bacterium UBA8803]|nr:hypothetical protein [Cyanobacteria bacterium UBA9273]HBL58237.1 hypothetical protein [Cyanobacteria bacterium UBA8803]